MSDSTTSVPAVPTGAAEVEARVASAATPASAPPMAAAAGVAPAPAAALGAAEPPSATVAQNAAEAGVGAAAAAADDGAVAPEGSSAAAAAAAAAAADADADADADAAAAAAAESAAAADGGAGYNLLVAGLTRDIGDDQLKDMFAPYGTVLRALVMHKANTASSRGFGFVLFSTEAEGLRAIAALNETPCGPNQLNVRRSKHDGHVVERDALFVRNIPKEVPLPTVERTFVAALSCPVKVIRSAPGSTGSVVAVTLQFPSVDDARRCMGKLQKENFNSLYERLPENPPLGPQPEGRLPIPAMLVKFAESEESLKERYRVRQETMPISSAPSAPPAKQHASERMTGRHAAPSNRHYALAHQHHHHHHHHHHLHAHLNSAQPSVVVHANPHGRPPLPPGAAWVMAPGGMPPGAAPAPAPGGWQQAPPPPYLAGPPPGLAGAPAPGTTMVQVFPATAAGGQPTVLQPIHALPAHHHHPHNPAAAGPGHQPITAIPLGFAPMVAGLPPPGHVTVLPAGVASVGGQPTAVLPAGTQVIWADPASYQQAMDSGAGMAVAAAAPTSALPPPNQGHHGGQQQRGGHMNTPSRHLTPSRGARPGAAAPSMRAPPPRAWIRCPAARVRAARRT